MVPWRWTTRMNLQKKNGSGQKVSHGDHPRHLQRCSAFSEDRKDRQKYVHDQCAARTRTAPYRRSWWWSESRVARCRGAPCRPTSLAPLGKGRGSSSCSAGMLPDSPPSEEEQQETQMRATKPFLKKWAKQKDQLRKAFESSLLVRQVINVLHTGPPEIPRGWTSWSCRCAHASAAARSPPSPPCRRNVSVGAWKARVENLWEGLTDMIAIGVPGFGPG